MNSYTRATFVLVALFSATAWSQEPAAPLTTADAERLIAQLNAALEERDAVILELLARVEALEGSLQASAAPPPVDTGERKGLESATLSADEELDEVDRLAQAALERALIGSGGLLLPAGVMEIEPSLAYSLSATNTVDIDCLLIEDILCIGDINSKRLRRETYFGDLVFRLGLPWDMQFDARVPFGYETADAVFGNGENESFHTTDLGDIEVALSRQLLSEVGWKPNLLAELRYKGRSGTDPFDLPEGSLASGTGFDNLKLGFTFVKVRDPVVLFGNLNHTWAFEDDKPEIGEVRPGNGFETQLGLALALNLETSLNFGWTQSWIDDTRVNGEKIPGSSRRPGSLLIGATYVTDSRNSFDVGVSFGLTDDAPDVEARVSFPWRFDYRIPFSPGPEQQGP